MSSHIIEKLGNGGAHRKELYDQITEILGVPVPEPLRKKIKKIIMDYLNAFQEDGVQKLIQSLSENGILRQQLDMLQKQSHNICNKCAVVKSKKNLNKTI